MYLKRTYIKLCSKYFKKKNSILTSHNAFNTKEAVNFVYDNTIKNLIKG